jgi:hypothetical protein
MIEWLLYLTAAAKFVSAMSSSRVLDVPDPLLLISNRAVLICIAFAELLVARIVVGGLAPRVRAAVVLWMATMFLLYRAFLWILDPVRPCVCLGFVGSWMGLTESAVSRSALVISLLLFTAGAVLFLSSGPVSLSAGEVVPLTEVNLDNERH